MDALIRQLYVFLGTEGLKGADVPTLVQHLHREGPFHKLPAFPEKAKIHLWKHILTRLWKGDPAIPNDFVLFTSVSVPGLSADAEIYTDGMALPSVASVVLFTAEISVRSPGQVFNFII